MAQGPFGIASIGVQLPPLFMDVKELAALRGADPDKYTKGLGCAEMALCPSDGNVVSLAKGAAERAIERWRGNIDDIGLLAVGTETARDMSRPLSAWVASELKLHGAVRSYEVKHACYGGTLALRQAFEWCASGANRGKAALVIASDVALYAEGDPGEPTQGAGAVAMIVDQGSVARIDPASYAYSQPVFDFWRPVGDRYPSVEGALSLDSYKEAAASCFSQLAEAQAGVDSFELLMSYEAVCFHVPFPKMVKKAVAHIGETFGWTAEQIDSFYRSKVDPTMEWNRACGNAYTASVWISAARALAGLDEGKPILAFSYGSGCGAELVTLHAGPAAKKGAWVADVELDLSTRRPVDASAYAQLRASSAPL
jgi:hydroxymethylglutaryl-CoA synthase